MALNPTSSRGGSGGVASVTAADTSIVVGGTATNPTLHTGTLDVIATDHPAAAAWSNSFERITEVSPGEASSDVAVVSQLPAQSSSLAALGMLAYSYSPNVPLASIAPGGGEAVRLMLLETMPFGKITGAAIGLEGLGIAPSGTAQLGLATFAGGDVATYVAVTADISAALTSGALGIRRFDFAAPYTNDGETPLWVAVAFTAGWGTDVQVAGASAEPTLGDVNTGHFRPRYASFVSGAGTLAVNGTHSAWQTNTGVTLWVGVY